MSFGGEGMTIIIVTVDSADTRGSASPSPFKDPRLAFAFAAFLV